jgi:hypothetical protein
MTGPMIARSIHVSRMTEMRRLAGDDRDAQAGRGDAVAREARSQHGEDGRDDDLTEELLSRPQAERPFPLNLGPVVQEADESDPDHEEEHEQTRDADRAPRQQVSHAVTEHGGADDHETTHLGRASLDVMRGRSVVPDELTPPFPRRQPDVPTGAEQPDEKGDDCTDQDKLHEEAALTSSRLLVAVVAVGILGPSCGVSTGRSEDGPGSDSAGQVRGRFTVAAQRPAEAGRLAGPRSAGVVCQQQCTTNAQVTRSSRVHPVQPRLRMRCRNRSPRGSD